MGTNAIVHPSRRSNVPSIPSQDVKRKKPAKSNLKSSSGLRTRIRDLTRQLDRAQTLPANLRVDKERELAGYKADLEKLREQNHRKKIIAKYHMVRFFERQKATRALKKLQKAAAALPPTSADRDSMQQAVHEAEVDLNYTIYCPLAEPYHSLYPRKERQQHQEEPNDDLSPDGNDAEDPKPRPPKPPLWDIIEKAMADGALEALRDGRSGRATAVAKPATMRRKAQQKKLSKQDPAPKAGSTKSSRGPDAGPEDNAEGNVSDGGFFEE